MESIYSDVHFQIFKNLILRIVFYTPCTNVGNVSSIIVHVPRSWIREWTQIRSDSVYGFSGIRIQCWVDSCKSFTHNSMRTIHSHISKVYHWPGCPQSD